MKRPSLYSLLKSLNNFPWKICNIWRHMKHFPLPLGKINISATFFPDTIAQLLAQQWYHGEGIGLLSTTQFHCRFRRCGTRIVSVMILVEDKYWHIAELSQLVLVLAKRIAVRVSIVKAMDLYLLSFCLPKKDIKKGNLLVSISFGSVVTPLTFTGIRYHKKPFISENVILLMGVCKGKNVLSLGQEDWRKEWSQCELSIQLCLLQVHFLRYKSGQGSSSWNMFAEWADNCSERM